MPTIDLPTGTLTYRAFGPANASGPPIVFVHGVLVNGELWTPVAEALAAQGIRSYAPDWPLGSHPAPMGDGAERSPRGVARLIISFLEAMELTDVTLIGNDTGGAICQFLLDTDPARIGRLVLTNCDAFDQFPPAPFDKLFLGFKQAASIKALMAPMRSARMRRTPLGFGMLTTRPIDDDLSRRWVDPCLTSAGVRRDLAAFVRAVDPQELAGVSERLGSFRGPALIVWGTDDRAFKLELGQRLRDVLSDATLVEVPGSSTFVSLDAPARLADEVASAFYAPALS
jgi:pimeloyl-ACP methyl ester carboxylesterase